MKSLATLSDMYFAILKVKREYSNAVEKNLVEIGKELRIVDENYDEELGYPEGLLMSVHNKHDILVDVVYDKVKVEKGKVWLHQCYWEDGEEDYWQCSEDIAYNTLLDIYANIEWTDEVTNGDEEEMTMDILCAQYEDSGEYTEHLIVPHDFYKTKEGKEKISEWMHKEFDECCDGKADERELERCIKHLLKGENGRFGDEYFWETRPVLS